MSGMDSERSTRTSTTSGRKLMRPFSCKYCLSFFSDLDSYRRHTTRHKKRYRVSSTPRRAQPHIRPLSWVVDLDRYEFNISVVGVIPKTIHKAEVTGQNQRVCHKRDSTERQNDQVKRTKRSKLAYQYECKHCGRSFKKRQQLWGHIRVHSEMGYKEGKSKLLECKHCKKLFAYKCDLSKHESMHEAEGRFQCPYCNSRFKLLGELNAHIALNKRKGKFYQCMKCDIYFETKCQKDVHVEQKHKKMLKVIPNSPTTKAKPKQEKLICPLCLKQFIALPSLLSHLTEHHSEKQKHPQQKHQDHKRLLCKFCDITFKKREYLRKHMKRAHPGFEETDVQSNSLPSAGNRSKKKKPVRCPLCDKLLASVSYLALHLQHSHVAETNDTDDSLLKCKDCHKLFKKKKYLAEHMKRMHKPLPALRSPKTFPAEDDGEQSHRYLICPAVYSTYIGMIKHIRRKHKASGLASAVQLGGGVDIKKDNAIPGHHNTTVDESKNKFQCLRCPESFNSEEDLVQHIPVHRNSLDNHKQRKDSVTTVKEEVPVVGKACQSFKCGYCLKAFDNRRILNRHMVQNHADDEIVI